MAPVDLNRLFDFYFDRIPHDHLLERFQLREKQSVWQAAVGSHRFYMRRTDRIFAPI